MTGKNCRRVIIAGVVFLLVSLFVNVSNAQAASPYQPPSPAPESFLGTYTRPGFVLQPSSRYSYVGQQRTLMAAGTTSYWAIAFNDSYLWSKSADAQKTWQTVVNDDDTLIQKNKLSVTSKKIGTVYYQVHYRYFLSAVALVFPYDYYSKVAAITTLPDPVPAKALQVTADGTYLYNNQKDNNQNERAMTTYVHGKIGPETATEDIVWSSNDDTLATVDPRTGLVVANTKGKSGTVTIWGTVVNLDGSRVTDAVTITIGGGLDDLTVDEGQSAHIPILGNLTSAPSQVKWHRVDTKGKDVVVATDTNTTYVSPTVTMADDQSRYWAEVTIKSVDGKRTQTIRTNKATLRVNPDMTPKVAVTSQLTNKSDPDVSENATTSLGNVVAGDTCQITGEITEKNPASTLVSGNLSVKLPPNSDHVAVTIDKQKMPHISYNPQSGVVAVSGIDFKKKRTHTYQVTFVSQAMMVQTFATTVQLTGHDVSGQLTGTYQGPSLIFQLSDGDLHATAHHVSFGTLTAKDVGHDVSCRVLMGEALLQVTDYRRKKPATTITLQQVTAFRRDGQDLAATLSFDDGQSSRPLSVGDDLTVAQIQSGQTVPSIGARNGQQLKVKLATAASHSGTYTATLKWAFVTAP